MSWSLSLGHATKRGFPHHWIVVLEFDPNVDDCTMVCDDDCTQNTRCSSFDHENFKMQDPNNKNNDKVIPKGKRLRYLHVTRKSPNDPWVYMHEKRKDASDWVADERLGTFYNCNFAGVVEACENIALPSGEEQNCQDWVKWALEAVRGMTDEDDDWDEIVDEWETFENNEVE